jgi:hypothetical protein
MGRTNDFVMLPAATVSVFPVTVYVPFLAVAVSERFTFLFEITEPVKKFAHPEFSWYGD